MKVTIGTNIVCCMKNRHSLHRLLTIGAVSILISVYAFSLAQQPLATASKDGTNFSQISSQSPGVSSLGVQNNQTNSSTPIENAWRSIAPNKNIDPVTPSVRALRSAYWDAGAIPLDFFNGSANSNGISVYPNGSGMSHGPRVTAEFASWMQEDLWIIAKFDSYSVYRTVPRGGLYTEINLKIDHVFHSNLATSLHEGDFVQVDLRGGTIIDAKGRTISILPEERDKLIMLGHTYLMNLLPCAKISHQCGDADFYYLGGRQWDLTSGSAKPVDSFDESLVRLGASRITGQSTDEIVYNFQTMLDAVKGK